MKDKKVLPFRLLESRTYSDLEFQRMYGLSPDDWRIIFGRRNTDILTDDKRRIAIETAIEDEKVAGRNLLFQMYPFASVRELAGLSLADAARTFCCSEDDWSAYEQTTEVIDDALRLAVENHLRNCTRDP